MKHINLAVVSASLLLMTACSDNESAQTYISKAENQLVEKQNSAAIISLKNALKVDVKNARARFLLGQLYLSTGDSENAIKELEYANRLKYDANEVLPLLARAYMLAESDADLLALSTQEKQLTKPNTQYLAYKTMAAIRTSDNELAQITVDAAIAVSDVDSFSMLAKAYLEFSQQNIAHAATLVERILIATPNNADAVMLQGKAAIVEKDYSLAVDSFKKYQKLQPNSGQVQIFIADALLKNKQFREAEEIADEILARIPTQPFMQYIKAMSRFEVKDYKEASRNASQSLNSGFNSFSLKMVAGASAFYLQNYEQSNHHLKDLITYLPVDHPARRMLAVSQLQLGLIDDISETLIGYGTSEQDNTQFLSTLSYELLEVGAFEKAQEMASYANNSNSLTAEQTARAGVLKLMMNDPSGIESLELALQQNPELISAELALAFASIKTGDIARATEIADKWLKEYPEKAGGYNLQSTIHFYNKEFTQGEVALQKSLQLEPDNVYALTQMVKLANHQKDTEQAKVLTERALAAHPENIQILRQYYIFHGDKEGLAVIEAVHQKNIDDVKYGILLAEALISAEQFKEATSVLDAYEVNVKTPKRYWQLVLAANTKQTDAKDIYLILEKWNKTNAYHIEPVLLLANYWTNKNSPDRALSVLQKSLSKHSNNLMLHLVKMQVLLNARRSDEAKEWFKVLDKFTINESLHAGIEGRILLLDGKFADAIPKLRQQHEAKADTNNTTYLALALEGNNQKNEAIKLLEEHSKKSAAENIINPRISLNLASMYLAENKDKAIVEYEQLMKAQPKNIVALNNLSWLYMEQGKLTQALEYSKQAFEQAPKIPNVVDTYAQVLLKSGDKADALVKSETAYKLSKGEDTDIALNYAEILLANSNSKEAKVVLESINAVTTAQQEKKQLLLK